ncbi:MAG: segregation ATPase FtsK/SpoIIIE, family [Actinomycetota bacterium]|nr:segregation ATPase FtsK/SpoIIIE, family [Actinomycetota bacterium]
MASRRQSKSARARKRAKARVRTRAAWRGELAEQLADHRIDALAIGLAVFGLLGLLAMFSDLVGPVGRGIDTAAAVLLGRGKVLVPIASLAAAASTVVQRRGGDDDDETVSTRRGLRFGLGLVLVCASVVGAFHLGRAKTAAGALEPLKRSGGVLGAAIGAPLRAGLGDAGAVIVLVAVGTLGMLLVVGTGVRQVAQSLATGGRFVGRHARTMLTLPSERADADAPMAAAASGKAFGTTPGAPGGRAVLFDELDDAPIVDLITEAEYEEEDEEIEEEEYEEEEADGEYAEEEYEEYDEDEEGEEGPEGEVDDEEEEDAGETQLRPVPKVAWKLPATSLLKKSLAREVDSRLVKQGGDVLESTMREFGVDARLIDATVGPTVTRYELELAAGVKVSKVTSLSKEIAYAMASHDVRILAPIPGRSAIGVEVPNKMRPLVTLGDILSSPEAKKTKHPLEVSMGRDIAGRAVFANLATFPHVLIAGQTGAGKSSCINSIVTSILMRTTPDEVRLILVDPKRVELGQYNNVPHLLTEVVTSPKKAANALDWAVREMEMRYDLLADIGVRDITGYNAMHDRGDIPTPDDPDPDTGKAYERLPFIVVVVDELADLMMVAARDVETSICRLAQMARAVGIHLVIATQRPSVDIITGVIKANIPSRLAFSVSTLADSRVILDQPGAEKLIGKGDMLLLNASSSRADRIQGAWVDEDCVRKVVAHWKRQVVQPQYVEGVQGADAPGGRSRSDSDETDELLVEAMELVVASGLGSTSMLQRKLRVGFARAGRLMDLLERRGVVGPSEGSKARSVLMSVEELEELKERS